MTEQNNLDILLKVDPKDKNSFQTVAVLRCFTLVFDVNSGKLILQSSEEGRRKLFADGGLQFMSVRGDSLFNDEKSYNTLRASFFNAAILNWQIIIPDFGKVQGPFQITSLECSKNYDTGITIGLALESAGQLTFA
jgi:TP901-1 family phage major tail protein